MRKMEEKKRRREEDKGTRGRGDKGTRGGIITHLFSLSPCLLVSLSPFLLVSLSPCLLVSFASSQTDEALTPAQLRGRTIYRKGGDGIKAKLGDDDFELPASTFPCANCHGLTGLGGKEGGLQPPPIAWDMLASPRSSSFSGQMRPAYDQASLKRAIAVGIDSRGATLHQGMPRYRMTDEQMNDLIAYLRVIGLAADNDPGVTGSTIKVGSALPLTGSLASLGEDLRAMLSTVFAEQNARGGIFGRRIELVVEDSRGDPQETAAATSRLLETHRVFALISSFAPPGSNATNELLKGAEVPLIGPVTLSPPAPATANPFIYYLLPDLTVQARVLVDFVNLNRASKFGESIAIFHSDHTFDRDAVLGVKKQAKAHSIRIAAEMDWRAGKFAPLAAIDLLQKTKPKALFFFASQEDLKMLAGSMERVGLNIPVLSATAMAGRGAFDLPPQFAGQLYLAHPGGFPDREGYAAFERAMMKSGAPQHPQRNAAFCAISYAAARIFIEAAKTSGRQLNRATFSSALAKINDFNTEVLPPISFGPHRRIGTIGAFVVQVDPLTKQFTPRTGWMEPQEKP
jgi:ABC-type branched-subunit amino acid transport system substrate-binding protein